MEQVCAPLARSPDAKDGSDYRDWPTAADAVVAAFQFEAQ